MITRITRGRTLPIIIFIFIVLYVVINLFSNNWTSTFSFGHVDQSKNILLKKNTEEQEVRLNEISVLLAKINDRLNHQEKINNQSILLSKLENDPQWDTKQKVVMESVKKLDILAFNKVNELHHLPPDLKRLLEQPIGKPSPVPKVNASFLPFIKDKLYKYSTCPKTVLQIKKYSSWFRDRYIPDVKLFMDAEDVNNYTDYYKLSHYMPPFGFKTIKRDVIGNLLNNPNFTNPVLKLRDNQQNCIRCAVVGCGGILNGSNAGAEIDSHDIVFRLNRAISKGHFADDVGRKTTFYTFFPESQHIADVEDVDVSFIFASFKSYDFEYISNTINDMPPPIFISRGKTYKIRKPAVDKDRLKLLHPDFFRYTYTHYLDAKSYRPTTGALIVILALQLCDEVDIYGFGYDHRFTMHYYDTTFIGHTDKSTALHDVDNERELWKKLHDEGIIRLFKRDI